YEHSLLHYAVNGLYFIEKEWF
ncbi:hypothetical protein A5849_002027, partial [Enterococcus sp. 10F3_DIV0382]